MEPLYNSWFVLKPIVYHHWYKPANVMFTGYAFFLLNAFNAAFQIDPNNQQDHFTGSGEIL